MTPVIISSLAIIIFAALIHANFQLSVSVLTLLSGHSIGKRTAHARLLRLMNGFVGGALVLTTLIVTTVTYFLSLFVNQISSTEQFAAAIIAGFMAGLGLATWFFYFRKGQGTTLWLPRSFATYLSKRSRVTKNSAESFALGMTSVIAELLFIIAPILGASLAIISLPTLEWQLIGIALYVTLSMLSLVFVVMMVGSGHTVAKLQFWREQNKHFLQFAAGGSLLVLAVFIFVDRVIGVVSYGGLW